jgi:hypothetical protein
MGATKEAIAHVIALAESQDEAEAADEDETESV